MLPTCVWFIKNELIQNHLKTGRTIFPDKRKIMDGWMGGSNSFLQKAPSRKQNKWSQNCVIKWQSIYLIPVRQPFDHHSALDAFPNGDESRNDCSKPNVSSSDWMFYTSAFKWQTSEVFEVELFFSTTINSVINSWGFAPFASYTQKKGKGKSATLIVILLKALLSFLHVARDETRLLHLGRRVVRRIKPRADFNRDDKRFNQKLTTNMPRRGEGES